MKTARTMVDYEAMILDEQEANDGEGGGGDGSDKARGARCSHCGYTILTPSEMKALGWVYPCNCRQA